MKRLGFVLSLLLLICSIVAVLSAEAPIEERAGRAEMRFLEGMIDHHQIALDMATDCLAKAATEIVKTLCFNILDAHTGQIVTMQSWLLNWYNVSYQPVSIGNIKKVLEDDLSHSMNGMEATDPVMMMGMMVGLNRLDGVDYEIAFLESMIDHHDDALHVAERILRQVSESTEHPDLKEFAQNIIDDQTAEIVLMETLIVELSR